MIEFVEAKRENVSVIVALAGASGSGKTRSALRLAYGLSPSGKIAFCDTEAKRALHHAGLFTPTFKWFDMRPPFRPKRFADVIDAAEDRGMEVLIVDSFSHEWDGEGGVSDWAQEIEDGIPAPGIENPRQSWSNDRDWWKDWKVKPLPGPGAWKEPKKGKEGHGFLINKIIQARLHLIFCLRADEKIKIEKQGNKTVVIPMGWSPICEKRFMYDMTVSFTLAAENDGAGKPNFDLPHKLPDHLRPFFPPEERIGEDAGRKLAAWARGDTAEPSISPEIVAKAAADGHAAAAFSTIEPLRMFWEGLTPALKKAIGGSARLAEWKERVERNAAMADIESEDARENEEVGE